MIHSDAATTIGSSSDPKLKRLAKFPMRQAQRWSCTDPIKPLSLTEPTSKRTFSASRFRGATLQKQGKAFLQSAPGSFHARFV